MLIFIAFECGFSIWLSSESGWEVHEQDYIHIGSVPAWHVNCAVRLRDSSLVAWFDVDNERSDIFLLIV